MKSLLNIRKWTLKDAPFTLKVRNHPKLMKWFRQDKPLTLEQQYIFIKNDLLYNKYFGCIIELWNKPIGVTNLKQTMEFGLALLPEYQNKGLEEDILNMLPKGSWSEVFLGNPMIRIYLNNGFEITNAEERKYYKKYAGFVDVMKVEKTGEGNYGQHFPKYKMQKV